MTDDQTADECGICLETLNTAVTLPCTHKFCADCLDGWKSKFGSSLKEERSKSCPLCRKKIPPSKDMFLQLEYHRTKKRQIEARGETTSDYYMKLSEHVNRLEAEISDYDGNGEGLLDYDTVQYMELPKYIYDAIYDMKTKRVMKWLGSPVDKKRLSARHLGHMNSTLAHLAVYTKNSGLLSILLQYGADVNALDCNGWNPFCVATKAGEGLAKILLEWGAEISLPWDAVVSVRNKCDELSHRDALIETIKEWNIKFANLISSELGGRRCEVINLPNHPHLNGKTCVVEKYITKKEKYKIIFEGSGNAALVGPNNLKRRDRTPLDCGYYISCKNGRMSRREFATKEECQAYVSSLGGDVKGTGEELASLKV